nr:radical SAM protein [Thermotoga sp. KOL6]
MDYKYVYGPVFSRRLGKSLGVSPIPAKTCNYSCVYCQLGRTTRMTNTRQEFYPVKDIIEEIANIPPSDADVVTIVGEGEPTLYSKLDELILGIRKYVSLPIAVITNGSLLYKPEVRKALSYADIVLPSLDAWDEKSFRRINRPHPSLKFEEIIEGLKTFIKEYTGQVWLEIMLMKNINDSDSVLSRIKHIVEEISPDRVYLNVPIRPPAEAWVEPPDTQTLKKAAKILNAIALDFFTESDYEIFSQNPIEGIISIIKRHPMTEAEVTSLLSRFSNDPRMSVENLRKHPRVILKEWRSITFYYYKVEQ